MRDFHRISLSLSLSLSLKYPENDDTKTNFPKETQTPPSFRGGDFSLSLFNLTANAFCARCVLCGEDDFEILSE